MTSTLLKPLATGLMMMMLALPATAQTTTDDGTAVETPTGDTLDMGQVVDGERQPGTLYTDEVFGDWARRCTANPEGDDPCHMYQLLKDGDGNDTAEVTIQRLPEGLQAAAGATVIVPLQTLLTQQLVIKIDGGQTKRYPFKFCTQIGCIAQIGLTAAEVNAFKRGAKATVTIVPAGAPDQKVNLDLSLTGFTAAYDSLPHGPAN